jgi:hypothetical protein
MGKLHELLAVEPSLEGASNKIIQETTKSFKDGYLFQGFLKRLEMFAEEDKVNDEVTDRLERTTTVKQKLDYMKKYVADYYDSLFQKDLANQEAKSDIMVDGATIAKNVPASFLLSMEKRLKQLRGVFEMIPTLQQGVKWEKATEEGEDVYKTVEPKVTFKTRKTKRSMIVAPATKEHKAQVQVWDDTENCGKYIETHTSGALTPAEKSEILERLDKLYKAIKQARERANCVEVSSNKIADDLMNYIIG